MLARFWTLKRSDRLRVVGWLVLAFGLVGALVFYGAKIRAADPLVDDQIALGYTRSLHRQMGLMMGQFGLILLEWQEALMTPTGEALLIASCAALVAGLFFRVAWVLDQEDQDQRSLPSPEP